MTSVARPGVTAGARAPGARRRRIGRLLRTEARLLWRFNAVAAAVGVTVGWVMVLRVVPAGAREIVAPLVLLTDVTALGFLFVPAMIVLERVEGVEAALRVTPVRGAERVAVRVGAVSTLSLVAGLAVIVATGLSDVAPRLLGLVALSSLFGLIAFALTGTSANLTTFLTRAPLVAVPMIVPALVHLLGVVDTPLLQLSPVTGAVDLLRGEQRWGGLAWLAAWIAAAAVVAARSALGSQVAAATDDRSPVAASGCPARPWRRHDGHYATSTAVRSLAAADRRSLVGDGLLLMLVGSVPLLAVTMRLIATVGVTWAADRYDIALRGYLPLIAAVLLVLHTPVIFGTLAGLLLLEDRDAGLLAPLETTRAGIRTLVGYRLAATVVVTSVTLALTLPLAGVTHAAGLAGWLLTAVAAGAVSVVPALLLAALARNRVQGVAVMKLIGLPLYLPLGAWFVTGAVRWAFAPLPTAWTAWTAWAPTLDRALVMALGTVVLSAALAVPLARRFTRQAWR